MADLGVMGGIGHSDVAAAKVAGMVMDIVAD